MHEPQPATLGRGGGGGGGAPLGTRRGLGLRGPSRGRELQSRQELGAGRYLDPRAASGSLPPSGPDPAVKDLTLPAAEPVRRISGQSRGERHPALLTLGSSDLSERVTHVRRWPRMTLDRATLGGPCLGESQDQRVAGTMVQTRVSWGPILTADAGP
ncbi:unnamed protein product [Rangifer tarandus platyrhynchus]|uniref:Uncharacterized protein n=1 Tax=Rangifer tarandus platyrhynchus TaxID=3082113 RepID=A0ABN8YZT1_RANTA|nr:unnamed protein product [Rangifer tarandus platyrhynchus]